jgi:hypothetical protein
MASLISTLFTPLTVFRRRSERCAVCHLPVTADDPRVRLPGGGHVHRGCSTYSMRVRPPQPATD